MPGFNTIPGSASGGGQANMSFVASIHMSTFNRSWSQGGTAGFYGIYSANQDAGYAYFVGSGVSTGVPLNRMSNITHSFTRIDVIAPVGDMISLYKVKVKNTNIFNNPFDADPSIGKIAIPSFPSIISSSGNFVLPNNALPLINVVLVGAGGTAGGGHGDAHGGCGGGGGGNVVKLTAYQAVGTTSVSVGANASHSPSHHRGDRGGDTYFGNVYALGGGGGGGWNNKQSWSYGESQGGGNSGGNGGGDGGSATPGVGHIQTAGTGLGLSGTPASVGGFSGGRGRNSNAHDSRAGGGGGAGGNGTDGGATSGGAGGIGHVSNIAGADRMFGPGGGGSQPNNNNGPSFSTSSGGTHGHGGQYSHNGHNGSTTYGQHGGSGAVIVRYYIA